MEIDSRRAVRADYEDFAEDFSFLKMLEIPLLIRILKEEASEECPMSAAWISARLSEITGLEHSEKTVLRKLKRLVELQKTIDDPVLKRHLELSIGGIMIEVSNRGKSVQHVQTRYYFKPLLDRGDVDMVCGTITSNQYLTLKEKEYLIAREKTLCYGDKYIWNKNPLPEKPHSVQNRGLGRVLKAVNILQDAIREKYQVDVIYGFYGEDSNRYRHPALLAKNEDNPYHLNPYALIWNDGKYYLLATHRGHANISHFRVDRIVSVQPAVMNDDATKNRKREPLPDSIKPFFKRVHGNEEFQVEQYATTYPVMAVFGEEDLCEAVIECKANAIGVVIDYFGMNLRIMPPVLEHGPDEVDINGHKQKYMSIRLPKVQYENLRAFCLLQHSIATVVSPDRLISDVKEGLMASVEKLPEVKK